MPYEDRLRTVGLTTLETRRLWADMMEVFLMFPKGTMFPKKGGSYKRA